jgi:hypothetical protein
MGISEYTKHKIDLFFTNMTWREAVKEWFLYIFPDSVTVSQKLPNSLAFH